jgi:outer membrane protein
MRRLGMVLTLAAGLWTVPAFASASFANKSLGIGLGYTKFLGDLLSVQGVLTDWAVPLTFEGGIYIESGFEAYLRANILFLYQRTGLGSDGLSSGILTGFGGQLGIRYLFLEESIRPYVNLHLAGFAIPKSDAPVAGLPGIGGGGGVDFFVGESVSIGARVNADLYLSLVPIIPRVALGFGVSATTYF